MQAAWADYAPKTPLSGPSAVVSRQLVDVPIELSTGDPVPARTPGAFVEHIRKDASGDIADTQYQFVSREEAWSMRNYANGGGDGDLYGPYASRGEVFVPQGLFVPQQGTIFQPRGLFGEPRYGDQRFFDQQELERQRQRRVDPDYFWNQQWQTR
jgi:hypothetical protein